MNDEDKKSNSWQMLEYQTLRSEITERIKILHYSIHLTTVLLALLIIFVFILFFLEADYNILITFLLTIPIFINLLAFNYQSNQNVLESIARYICYELKPQVNISEVLNWEYYFAKEKQSFKIDSATKVFPFLIPSLIPIYLLVFSQPLLSFQLFLAYFDLLLLAVMLIGFRYKLRRVK